MTPTKPTILLLAFLGAGLGTRAQQPGAAPQPTFTARVDMAAIAVTVRDRNDRLVTTLTRGDFRLVAGGRPLDVRLFSNEARPLTVALMLNTVLVKGFLNRPTPGDMPSREREIGRAFVAALGPEDRATIGSFALEVAISPIVTADHRVLQRVLEEELWPAEGHPVGTAVHVALGAIPTDAPRIVVVGTNGVDDCRREVPCVDVGRAQAEAREKNALIYGVQVRSLPYYQSSSSPLLRMARDSGGGYLHLREEDDLPSTMAAVVDELRHEYTLGFDPRDARDGAASVKVETRRSGLTVTARKLFRPGR